MHRFRNSVLTAAAFAALTALASTSPVLAGSRAEGTVLMPEDAEFNRLFTDWTFSQAVEVDGTIHLSGMVAMLDPAAPDMKAGLATAFRQIGEILARAGSSWADVVDITSYHTDIDAQLDLFVAEKRRHLSAPYPTWTAVQVVRLVPKDAFAEIRVVAKKKKR